MSIIEELSEKYSNEKAQMIDVHLLKFLAENGLASNGTVQDIKEKLAEHQFEVITNITKTITGEIYTFKLCKVYKTSQLNILNPIINVENGEECQCACHFIDTTGCQCKCNK